MTTPTPTPEPMEALPTAAELREGLRNRIEQLERERDAAIAKQRQFMDERIAASAHSNRVCDEIRAVKAERDLARSQLAVAVEALISADGQLKPGGAWEELGTPVAKATVQDALRKIQDMGGAK